MRTSNSKPRQRNKSGKPRHNNSGGNIINRVFDSSGPVGKVRGTPRQIIDKYQALAQDAMLAGDRIAQESFLQFAEHYLRLLGEAQREVEERANKAGQESGAGVVLVLGRMARAMRGNLSHRCSRNRNRRFRHHRSHHPNRNRPNHRDHRHRARNLIIKPLPISPRLSRRIAIWCQHQKITIS